MVTQVHRSVRWLAAASAIWLAAWVAACTEPPSSEATTTEGPTTTPASASASSTRGRGIDPEVPGRNCDSGSAVTGDFDGDGTADLAMFEVETLELIVCTAQETFAIPTAGQGEVLLAADLNGDGTDELLTGGTTAWGAGAEVVTLVAGVLDYVHTPDRQRLSLWQGLPPGGFLAYGCADFTNDGRTELAVIEGTLPSAGQANWARAIYRIEGHVAVPVATDAGSFDPSGSIDPLSNAVIIELAGERCLSTGEGP